MSRANKATGHAWLPEVPEYWDVARLKRFSKRYTGGTPDRNNDEYWEEGDVPWLNSGAVNQGLITRPSKFITKAGLANSSARWVPPGAIVIALAGQGKTKGMAAQVAIAATCNQSLAAILLVANHPRFIFWWLTSQYWNIRNLSSGDGRDGLNLEMIGDIPCPVPPASEQTSIASFLDHETARIDALIEKKRRLLELLEEKRLAVITHAVTKGFDPTAPIKESGIDWLGQIPAHWDAGIKFQYLARSERHSFVNGPFGSDLLTSELTDEGVPVLYSGDIRETGFFRKSDKHVTSKKATEINFCRADPGDLLLAKVGDPPGTACVYPTNEVPAVVTQDVVRVRLDELLADPHYLAFLLNSAVGRLLVSQISIEATRGRFSLADMKAIRMCLPPVEEQRLIVNEIGRRLQAEDALREQLVRSVEYLIEYRSALITNAVTGKVDVRGMTKKAAAE